MLNGSTPDEIDEHADVTDRRKAWATMSDPVLKDRIQMHLLDAPEWEARLESMERHFDRLIARLDGMTTVWRWAMAVVVCILGSFAGALTWYANQRNQDLNQLSEATNRLAIIAEVLTTRQDRDEVDKIDFRRRLEQVERERRP